MEPPRLPVSLTLKGQSRGIHILKVRYAANQAQKNCWLFDSLKITFHYDSSMKAIQISVVVPQYNQDFLKYQMFDT